LSISLSNHLEKLKNDLADYWSLRINKQWRIIFQWREGDAYQVDIVDYH
jgi:proteic killer suppression protein